MANRGRGRTPPRIAGMVSLKVDNLTYRTNVEDLRRVFGRFGDIGDVYIPRDPYSFESRGFAFVRYYDQRDADDAIDAMDGAFMDGRELRVSMAKYARPSYESARARRGGKRRSRSRSPSRTPSWSRSRSKSRSRSVSKSRRRRRRRSRSHSSSSRSSHSRSNSGKSRSPRRRSRSR